MALSPREELEQLRAEQGPLPTMSEREELEMLRAEQGDLPEGLDAGLPGIESAAPYLLPLINAFKEITETQEAARTVGSSAVAVPVSGLAGAATIKSPLLNEAGMGTDPETSKRVVEGVQDALTIEPESPGAIQKLETLQDLYDKGVELARIPIAKAGQAIELITGRTPEEAKAVADSINERGLSETYADSVLEKSNSPLLASLAYSAPQIIPELIGRRVVSRPPTDLEIRNANKIRAQNKELEVASPDTAQPVQPVPEVGRRILDGAGQAVNNKLFDEAVRQGWEPQYVALMQGAPAAERAKYLDMLQIIKNNKADPRTAIRDIHSNILGESVLQRYRPVQEVNKRERINLDRIAEGLEGQSVDLSSPLAEFSENLDDLGVYRTINDKGRLVVDFADSDLPSSSHEPIRKVLNNIFRMERDGKMRAGGADALAAHKLKKVIDENVKFGQDSPGGLAGSATDALKGFRRAVDGALDSTFDDYNQTNLILSDTIEAMNGFKDRVGPNVDLSAPSAAKTVGILMRRPTSNAKSGGAVMDAVDRLEEVAKKYGAEFDDNIDSQMLIVQEMERMFPRVGSTTLEGVTTKSILRAAQKSTTEKVIDVAGAITDKAQGVNEQNAMKALERLLSEGTAPRD